MGNDGAGGGARYKLNLQGRQIDRMLSASDVSASTVSAELGLGIADVHDRVKAIVDRLDRIRKLQYVNAQVARRAAVEGLRAIRSLTSVASDARRVLDRSGVSADFRRAEQALTRVVRGIRSGAGLTNTTLHSGVVADVSRGRLLIGLTVLGTGLRNYIRISNKAHRNLGNPIQPRLVAVASMAKKL